MSLSANRNCDLRLSSASQGLELRLRTHQPLHGKEAEKTARLYRVSGAEAVSDIGTVVFPNGHPPILGPDTSVEFGCLTPSRVAHRQLHSHVILV